MPFLHVDVDKPLLSSIGRKPFENLRLNSGLKTFVGGLEVELDSRITRSEFPQITKTPLRAESEHEHETQLSVEGTTTTRPRENSNSPIKSSTSSGTKFIPPTTFYAKPTPKPKSASSL